MGGGNSKVPSWGVSFVLDRGDERCFVPLPLGFSVSGFVPHGLFVPCVSVNFRSCPGPLKCHAPFPRLNKVRDGSPPPLLSRMSPGESAPAGDVRRPVDGIGVHPRPPCSEGGDKHNNMLPTALCLSAQRMPRTETVEGGQVVILGWAQRGGGKQGFGGASRDTPLYYPHYSE